MRFDKWKIYDKKGSYLNSFLDTALTLEFVTDAQNARGAAGYAFTDPSAMISDAVITDSGWNYDPATDVRMIYTFGNFDQILPSSEASINFVDVSIFAPEPETVQGIGSVDLDVSTKFIYPSTTTSAAIFMPQVSVELVETIFPSVSKIATLRVEVPRSMAIR